MSELKSAMGTDTEADATDGVVIDSVEDLEAPAEMQENIGGGGTNIQASAPTALEI
jgi:hypothetical protein